MRKIFRFVFSVEFLYILLIAAQVAAIIFLCVNIPAFIPFGLAALAPWTVTIIATVILFTSKAPSETRGVLFFLFCTVPVITPIIYLVSRIGNKKSVKLELRSEPDGNPICPTNGFNGAVQAGYTRAEYYADGTHFFNSLFSEIDKAKSYIYLEFYIISRGKIFERLLTCLKKAKERGVIIRILTDGYGCAFRLGRREIKELKKLGEIKTFHRLNPLPLARHNRRDHRKIVVIDGKTAFTGGINIGDEYANIDCDYGYWKDSALLIEGQAAKAFEGMFLSVWDGGFAADIGCSQDKSCLVFCDTPPKDRFCEDAFISAISSAKERVHILTPYFCTSEKLESALAFCARRGVDVKIILPHVPDNRYVYALSRTCAKSLADTGTKFYEFTPGFMHSKCLICDDTAFLGSYNFDFRSTHLNLECGAAFKGEITAAAERDFTNCLVLSTPLVHGKSTPVTRFKRFFLRLFSPLI